MSFKGIVSFFNDVTWAELSWANQLRLLRPQIDKNKMKMWLPKSLTAKSDLRLISPYNISLESNSNVTRIKEMITN